MAQVKGMIGGGYDLVIPNTATPGMNKSSERVGPANGTIAPAATAKQPAARRKPGSYGAR